MPIPNHLIELDRHRQGGAGEELRPALGATIGLTAGVLLVAILTLAFVGLSFWALLGVPAVGVILGAVAGTLLPQGSAGGGPGV
jgi:hypothetical protein